MEVLVVPRTVSNEPSVLTVNRRAHRSHNAKKFVTIHMTHIKIISNGEALNTSLSLSITQGKERSNMARKSKMNNHTPEEVR